MPLTKVQELKKQIYILEEQIKEIQFNCKTHEYERNPNYDSEDEFSLKCKKCDYITFLSRKIVCSKCLSAMKHTKTYGDVERKNEIREYTCSKCGDLHKEITSL